MVSPCLPHHLVFHKAGDASDWGRSDSALTQTSWTVNNKPGSYQAETVTRNSNVTSICFFQINLAPCGRIASSSVTSSALILGKGGGRKKRKHLLCWASTVKTGQAMHCASNQPCILVHTCHFQLPPRAQISQPDPEKKRTGSLNKKSCCFFFSNKIN